MTITRPLPYVISSRRNDSAGADRMLDVRVTRRIVVSGTFTRIGPDCTSSASSVKRYDVLAKIHATNPTLRPSAASATPPGA